MPENINRIKVVLCEKNVKAKWLAEQLKVNPTTVSNGVPILRSLIYTLCGQ